LTLKIIDLIFSNDKKKTLNTKQESKKY